MVNRYFIWLAVWATAAASLPSADCSPAIAPMDLARERMIEELRRDEGIENPRVFEAMRQTPRHRFVAGRLQSMAYYDMALPLGRGQTISPPSMVAGMIDRLDPQPEDRVLEVGTGTGYQAAVLSRLVAEVYTIEIVKSLARKAESTLVKLGCLNVQVKTGDGYLGWPEHAPFDRIIVACSPEKVPPPLIDQLKEGGTMVIPLGAGYDQMLYVLTKTNRALVREAVAPTVFVPMTGRAELERERPTNRLGPSLVNGSFEAVQPGISRPTGWYHQRQMTVVADADAPDGGSYALFENHSPSRTAEASQAFGLDGRRFRALLLSGVVRGDGIVRGPGERELASTVLAFYNAKRELISVVAAGDWLGTFDWRSFEQRVAVPSATREAIVRVGLCGATGRLSVDGLEVSTIE